MNVLKNPTMTATTAGRRRNAGSELASQPPRRRPVPLRLRPKTWLRIASVVVILGAWEIYGRNGNPVLVTYPSAIAQAFYHMIQDGTLGPAFADTLEVLLIGLALGTFGGLLLGFFAGRVPSFGALIDIPTIAFYALPGVALVPVLVLWFGFGTSARVIVVLFFTIFPVLINTWRGVSEIDPRLEEVARSFCSSEVRIWRDLVFPSALPYVVTGIRLAIGRGLVGVVVAEFYTAISGLGYLIVSNANNFQTARVFVPIVILMGLGIVFTKTLEAVERKIAPWAQASSPS